METMRTLKTILARLAGVQHLMAMAASGDVRDRHPRPRPTQRSELYAPEMTPTVAPKAANTKTGSTKEVMTKPATTKTRTTKQRDGDEGEALARRHLERAGLTFVAANVRYRDGEIDLVMRERPRPALATPSLVFVEVRRRAGAGHGGAAASITRDKRRRIVAAAAHYLVGLGLRTLPPSRFDVVTLDGDAAQGLRIVWIRDAFRDEG